MSEQRPRVVFVGRDGHAFDVLPRCQRAAREAGWSTERFAAFRAEATASDYRNLFVVVITHFDVE